MTGEREKITRMLVIATKAGYRLAAHICIYKVHYAATKSMNINPSNSLPPDNVCNQVLFKLYLRIDKVFATG